MIRASVHLATLLNDSVDAGATARKLDRYAKCIGLAFQVQDDILDVTGNTEQLGKQTGADRALNKPTYPSLLGLSGARERARELHESALHCLDGLDENADPLRWLSQYIVDRSS